MVAGVSHLVKLGAIQHRAEKLCGGTAFAQSLANRRDAGAFGLICKMLSGQCVEPVMNLCEDFKLVAASSSKPRRGIANYKLDNKIQMNDLTDKYRKKSTKAFSRCFLTQAKRVFDQTPSDIKAAGLTEGWLDVIKAGQVYHSYKDIEDGCVHKVVSC